MSKSLAKLTCKLKGHLWKNDRHFPVHGYNNEPYDSSYCGRCGKAALPRRKFAGTLDP
jgi:hypothetical protein